MNPCRSHRGWSVLLGVVLLAGVSGCREAVPVDTGREALVQENETLRKELEQSKREQQNTRDRLLITQKALNELETEHEAIRAAHTSLQESSRALAADHNDLRGQFNRMADQLRAAEAELAERKVEAGGMVTAVAPEQVAATPSFALYDVAFIGEMDFEGKKRLVGRFSVTNHTDQPLRIFANSLFRTIRLEIPPRGVSNSIHMVARQGDVLRVNTSNQVQSVTW